MSVKIKDVIVAVVYEDADGDEQRVHKFGKTFESAEENLGKLQRFINSLKQG